MLGIWAIAEWILDNLQMAILITTLIVLLGVSGNLNVLFRNAINGLKEATTPTGLIILGILIYVVYLIWMSIKETI